MRTDETYRFGLDILNKAGIQDASTDVSLLMEEVFGVDRTRRLSHPEEELGDSETEKMNQFVSYVNRRADHIPLQHILGYQDFMGLRFEVNPNVLVPRFDTEILVEEAMKRLHDGMSILDMCTGSGCILISLLKYSNECEGLGADISKEALDVANSNASKLLSADKKISFVQTDLFEKIDGRFDMIVSNPPYIPSDVISSLDEEVRLHDPMKALDGGSDGLDFYREIIKNAGQYLNVSGTLIFEIGHDQGAGVKALMEQASFIDVNIVKDLQGLDRVVAGNKSCLTN